ncbi:MAG: helix-turn-helix transcriptional regulator [Rhizobiales bacterium]|nr:helix-turn-helix transcriptional regulator [Hyphomicrobiales bacterium]
MLKENVAEAAEMLTAMSNTRRLMVLCSLLEGEKSVGQLADIVGLSSAALSQHLGKMRALRLVKTRRDGQSIYYDIDRPEVRKVLQTLHEVFCKT